MSNETNNNQRNGQYGKKGFKPRKSQERSSCDLDKIETNDPSYWNKSKNFENVSKFTWDLIVGYPRKWDSVAGLHSGDNIRVGPDALNLNPAQIMAIDVTIGPGWANEVNDGVNRSLAQLMAKIRSTLSTANFGFETAELGYLFSSTSSIASNIGYAKRVLESFTLWKDRNYAFPRMLIKMMGFEYEDIRDNIQSYAAKLNALIDMYNHIGLLDIFDTYERQYAMMHNVFCDEDSELAQLYIFKPSNYYIYEDTASKCSNHVFDFGTDDAHDFTELLDVITDQINAWYGSNDLYQINGVLLRAFKDAPRQVIPYFEMGTQVEPVQDKAFLMQIMNCTICPISQDDSGCDITQDPTTQNYIMWKPRVYNRDIFHYVSNNVNSYLAGKQILRLFDTDISFDDNMELTRLLNFGEYHTSEEGFGNGYIEYRNCGSEIVNRITIASYDSVSDSIDTIVEARSNFLNTTNDSLFIGMVQAFRYIPCFITYREENEEDDTGLTVLVYPEGYLGDVYNWMLYDRADWELLQFSAYQSLWTPKHI